MVIKWKGTKAMRKLRQSIVAKIVALILSYVTIIMLIASTVAVGVMGYYKFYFSNPKTVTKEILTDMAKNEANHFQSLIYNGTDLRDYYSDKNVYFTLTDAETGKGFESNYSGEKYIVLVEQSCFMYEWFSIEKSEEIWEKYGEEAYYQTDKVGVEKEYLLKLYIAQDMTKNDMFSVMVKIIEIGFKLEYLVVFLMIASLILFVALLCFLFLSVGHCDGEIKLNFLDKIPLDLYTAFIAAIAMASIVLVKLNSYDFTVLIVVAFLVGSFDYFFGMVYLLSIATRIKTQTLFKNTLIYKFLSFLFKHLKKFCKFVKDVLASISIVKKSVLLILAVLSLEFIVMLVHFNTAVYRRTEIMFLLLIPIHIVFILFVLYLAVTLKKIKIGGEKIAGGDLAYKIDTKYMYLDFKEFSESLNNINEGLQTAVNEKMKSERFKTELITNVSHDIKTPLTSIINYVDLLKKEDIEDEAARGYIEVLDRQSMRLKKLVEDLVEASKASTGNLSVNLEPCDVRMLLNQAIGEFEEKLQKAGIKTVLKVPDGASMVMADGRHLWRIFDNLLNNICKYALNGTRAYIDIIKENAKVCIIFRNVSRYELNVSADELMERFVRGDSSRNTEGSGLGLSIAKSLAELQNGKLDISVDGDLFKVKVILDEVV